MCRFLNADGYVSTGQGVTSFNMFAYCGNNPVNRADPSGESAVLAGLLIGFLVDVVCGLTMIACVYVITDALVRNPPAIPSISSPKTESKTKENDKADEKEGSVSLPKLEGKTYYHSTTAENAALIKATGIMKGSDWEGGYVYAFRNKPNDYAVKNSGAHFGVIISFKTTYSFSIDPGITDPKVQAYGPVVSTTPGPIVVWDVEIVG